MVEVFCSQGSSNQNEILLVILIAIPLGLLIYLLYKNPCFVKKKARSLYDWVFVDSDIAWPGQPEGCTEDFD